MKIMHQIFRNWSSNEVVALKELGIDVNEGLQSLIVEEDERYWRLKPLLDSWYAPDMVGTRFSDQDFENASFLMALPDWQTGYPQPESGFGYLRLTYDLKQYCPNCGAGAHQNAPFRLKKEPKWGKKKLFMLYWVYDEIFVKKDVYERVFLPLGIESRPVLLHRPEKIIESTVQLVIPESRVSLNLDSYALETCEQCKQKKYLPITKGYFPPFLGDSLPPDLSKSREYYGSGGSASKWILISKALRAVLVRENIGMVYVPMER